MATRSEYFKSPRLSFGQQVGRLSGHPGSQVSLRKNKLIWTGELQPSPLSETYAVRIEYTLGKRPKVWVLRPPLRRRTSEAKIPHTFADGSVCLHLHGQWTPAMFIADNIIPWLTLWLLHYEAWHATGDWMGGGHEPKEGK